MELLISGLVGALIGTLATAGFHIWRLHREDINARINELCDCVVEAATAASEYWATDFDGSDNKARRIAEAKILGLQSLVDGLYSEVRLRLKIQQSEAIDRLQSELLDNMSGGDFSVQGRPSDPVRTASVLQSASEVVVALRRAHHSTMPFSGLSLTYYENRNRKPDLPRGWETPPKLSAPADDH